ncbi:helicase-associated domain-containing protein [Nocardioides sp. B-3]|nr:helicase-associated domain-containing protein [Nocardioides sp. B-3]UUZ57808.1 helicase-associated domain-containing protein [Nocardioides sp. B-3]
MGCPTPAARSSPTTTTPRWPRSPRTCRTPSTTCCSRADLTAVAPGPLETELARTLHLLADVESRGGATVYRFTNGSVRRAFDAGWSALEVHDFVGSVSRTPVPQPLTYLVDDVRADLRHGPGRAGRGVPARRRRGRAHRAAAQPEGRHARAAPDCADRADLDRARRRAPPAVA